MKRVTLAHRFEDGLGALFQAGFRAASLDQASEAGGRMAGAIRAFAPGLNRRALADLAHAFPERDAAEHSRLLSGVWNNLGRVVAEIAHYDTLVREAGTQRLMIEGREHVEAVRASERPHVFISAHLANWEMLAIAGSHLGLPVTHVYRAANNALFDARIQRLRRVNPGATFAPKGREGARQAIQVMKRGEILGLLVDQKMNDGIEARLFGRPAMTSSAPAEFALRYDAPVVPVFIERRGGAHFTVHVDAPLEPAAFGEGRPGVHKLTQTINDRLEAEIRKRPDQWLWLHKRWPAQPLESSEPGNAPANSAGSS